MVNVILFLTILLFFSYAIYEQFLIEKRKGQTKLKVPLKKQHKIDSLIFIGLIIILVYQSFTQSGYISPTTLFLLAAIIILAIYNTFFRTSMLIFKTEGVFYLNIYIDYQKIHQLNLTQNNILVINLKNKKSLFAPLAREEDGQRVVNFFGADK
ncbi:MULTISPECIES: DUF986 family protein [unclassified Pasteurella]|uniref:DUF986 family protein n=1 Tax=unclassified Pasteurella TaxID=2621516 RepID=UPI0010733AF2|nr:DUF986 family protein [Pasteurella sp. 19428wF3_WM03]TFU52948.1 DUF986 family protein [Pasteurella sp. WM03]